MDRILGQPSLIRESSRGKYPWSGFFKRAMSSFSRGGSASQAEKGLEDVVLNPSLKKRVSQLVRTMTYTKAHQAPFRNVLFHGPPGTGKTLVAREIARSSVSDLEYLNLPGLRFFFLVCIQ